MGGGGGVHGSSLNIPGNHMVICLSCRSYHEYVVGVAMYLFRVFDDVLLPYVGFEAGPSLIFCLLLLMETHIMAA